jgi:hypothetical protein
LQRRVGGALVLLLRHGRKVCERARRDVRRGQQFASQHPHNGASGRVALMDGWSWWMMKSTPPRLIWTPASAERRIGSQASGDVKHEKRESDAPKQACTNRRLLFI